MSVYMMVAQNLHHGSYDPCVLSVTGPLRHQVHAIQLLCGSEGPSELSETTRTPAVAQN